MPDDQPKSVMRSLGEFFGHIAKGLRTDPAKQPQPQRREVSRTTEEEQRDTPQGKLVLRRTIIEEVETTDGPSPS